MSSSSRPGCERCGRESRVHIRSDATQTRHFCLACAEKSAARVSSPPGTLRNRIVLTAAFVVLALVAIIWIVAR